MKNAFICLLVLFASSANAQLFGSFARLDSFVVDFTVSDTIPARIIPDTAAAPLWQIGHTYKTTFALTPAGAHGIMTDTLNHYPVGADNSFVLKFNVHYANPIVFIWHRYETDSAHDGGMFEYSTDSGATWMNITACHLGSPGVPIYTENFYSYTDTLTSGHAAFSGSSHGERMSAFSITNCHASKTTTTACSFNMTDDLLLRFRFISDSTADALSGWLIDSIKVVTPGCGIGAIAAVQPSALRVSPNPSYDGLFYFPELDQEQQYILELYNPIGEMILKQPYTHTLSLERYPPGTYFYKVSNKELYYSGRLLKE